jgi:hypothetical protein
VGIKRHELIISNFYVISSSALRLAWLGNVYGDQYNKSPMAPPCSFFLSDSHDSRDGNWLRLVRHFRVFQTISFYLFDLNRPIISPGNDLRRGQRMARKLVSIADTKKKLFSFFDMDQVR